MHRFEFGKNWQNYAKTLDEEKIRDAIASLSTILATPTLAGKSFLDAGSGSGLFSLAAHRLGASRVVSFDYDTDSAHCTEQLRIKNAHSPVTWTVSQGDVLDTTWLAGLGQFDIVYSWGVLHHTGNMWRALENICASVKAEGHLFISIYNDQGWISRAWLSIKKTYNACGPLLKKLLIGGYLTCFFLACTLRGIMKLIPPAQWYKSSGRGMNVWHDAVDWIGGYPFETAKPAEISDFFQLHGFILIRSKTTHGMGCNEFLFQRRA